MTLKEYHKIKTIFKRGSDHKIIIGDYSSDAFEYLKDCTWVGTEKVDGTNIRVMWDGKSLTFGGRTDNASITTNLATRLQNIFFPKIKWFIDVFPNKNICLYGEGYGVGIQKAGSNYIPNGNDFVLFDAFSGAWMQREDVERIADQLEIKTVPIVCVGNLNHIINKK